MTHLGRSRYYYKEVKHNIFEIWKDREGTLVTSTSTRSSALKLCRLLNKAYSEGKEDGWGF